MRASLLLDEQDQPRLKLFNSKGVPLITLAVSRGDSATVMVTDENLEKSVSLAYNSRTKYNGLLIVHSNKKQAAVLAADDHLNTFLQLVDGSGNHTITLLSARDRGLLTMPASMDDLDYGISLGVINQEPGLEMKHNKKSLFSFNFTPGGDPTFWIQDHGKKTFVYPDKVN